MVIDGDKVAEVLAKRVTFLFTAYHKNVVHVHHCNNRNRPCLDQPKHTGIRKALLETRTIQTGD